MGVISIRLNNDEEKVLKRLVEHFHEDKSTLINRSLLELYENISDLNEIERFETKERRGKAAFFTGEDILIWNKLYLIRHYFKNYFKKEG